MFGEKKLRFLQVSLLVAVFLWGGTQAMGQEVRKVQSSIEPATFKGTLQIEKVTYENLPEAVKKAYETSRMQHGSIIQIERYQSPQTEIYRFYHEDGITVLVDANGNLIETTLPQNRIKPSLE
jgi:surface antigen